MIIGINDALKAIAYALLVLFFVIGVMKTCGSFTELKRPEVAFKCFIRFVLAQAAVTYGMELMTALFSIAQGGDPDNHGRVRSFGNGSIHAARRDRIDD